MRINIPQYLRADVSRPDWDPDNGDTRATVTIYIGETPVHTSKWNAYMDDEDLEMEGMSAFGEMLKRVFDRVETLSGDDSSPVKIGD